MNSSKEQRFVILILFSFLFFYFPFARISKSGLPALAITTRPIMVNHLKDPVPNPLFIQQNITD